MSSCSRAKHQGKFDKSFWRVERSPTHPCVRRVGAGKRGLFRTGGAWDRPVIILEAALMAVLHGVGWALMRPMTGTLK